MKRMLAYYRINLFVLFLATIFLFSCNDSSETPEPEIGNLTLTFNHLNNGSPLVFDTMIYENAAGNKYLVNEIQYFISDVSITGTNGEQIFLDAWEDMHYVDTDIENSFTWAIADGIPIGEYSSINFTFGINEQKNQSLMFVNPPKSFMFWPDYLGGGYHYLKLNGKWLTNNNEISPFNFHLGIGQIYYSYPDSITGFVQNYFDVSPEMESFEISAGETTTFELTMNVENWFISPNVYNHDDWGGDIMQNQDAMKLVSENGRDVFTIKAK